MKLILAGPPQSGKSCLREGLKQVIRSMPGAAYPYIITACPDGEGAWFQETAASFTDVAKRCKATYKGSFTPEFTKRIADSVKNCKLPLTIVDIGGRISDENRQICASATHIVILAGDMNSVPSWLKFAEELELEVIAVLHSDYYGTADSFKIEDGILTGSIHHLERGEVLTNRPAIWALAELINKIIGEQNVNI